MESDGAGKAFRDLLSELGDLHDWELACQRDLYDQHLSALNRENAWLRSHLDDVRNLMASVDWSLSLHGPDRVVERRLDSAEAGCSPKVRNGPGVAPSTAPGTAPVVTSPAAASSTAAAEEPAAAAREVSPPPGDGTRDGPRSAPRWLWEVVGGSGTGGILVREGESIDSRELATQLSTGATVEEIRQHGDSLHFQRLTGAGPDEGWISTKSQGRDLAVRSARAPLKPRQQPPATVGLRNEAPLPIALLFGEDLEHSFIPSNYQDFPELRDMLSKANPILDSHLKQGFENLTLMRPMAMSFIKTLANLELLRGQHPEDLSRASAMMGMGAGRYVALCAAGVLSFEDALKLLMTYAKVLAKSSRLTAQMAMSVTGLEQDRLQLMCIEACRLEGKDSVCRITAYLSHRCFVVGGTAKAARLLSEMAKRVGAQVGSMGSSAHHTTTTEPVQAEFDAALDKALPNMRPPLHTIWMNATAEPMRPGCDPADIVADLKEELTHPMLLLQSTDAMRTEGICKFYHVRPLSRKGAPIQASSAADWQYMIGAGWP